MKILFVEDHQESRDGIARLLTHCGHQITEAASLAQAHRSLDQEKYDVLLSDLGLLDGEAFDLVQRAKASHAVLAAIALTGHPVEQDGERARQAGFDHYLTKPVDFHALRSLLDKIAT